MRQPFSVQKLLVVGVVPVPTLLLLGLHLSVLFLALVPVLFVLALAVLAGIGAFKLIEERHLVTSRYCSAPGRQG